MGAFAQGVLQWFWIGLPMLGGHGHPLLPGCLEVGMGNAAQIETQEFMDACPNTAMRTLVRRISTGIFEPEVPEVF
jgi:hypothetical protein